MGIQTDIVYSHTGYDVTSCFQSVFIQVRKTAENATTDGFVCDKSNAVSKESSNFSSEEYISRTVFSCTWYIDRLWVNIALLYVTLVDRG